MIPEADYYVTRLNQLQNLADNYQHLADDHRRLASERAEEIDELRRQLAECQQERDEYKAATEYYHRKSLAEQALGGEQ